MGRIGIPRGIELAAALIACTWFSLFAACNPFTAERGTEGQDCFEDGTCNQSLVCYQSTCHVLADCSHPAEIDCRLPGGPEQGLDGDEDGWGECCDCNDEHAGDFPGASEDCDGRDNSCDGQIDEGNVCANCVDRDGDLYGANCALGADCDDTDVAVHPKATETCDGRDEDCDGQTDEELADRACPLIQGVCAGTMQRCEPESGWSTCDYGPNYMDGADDTCDGNDNDCDGETDEDAVNAEPEIGPLASDGIDNNCNGLTDEPGGAMVPHPTQPGLWVDSYELTVFENIDCTGTIFGQTNDDYPAGWPAEGDPSVSLYACSLRGILPSGHLSWYRAQRACAAQGKRLCSESEWELACHGANSTDYPYGELFVPGICNNGIGGAGQLALTGEYLQCTAGSYTWDMSGNLVEWLRSWSVSYPASKQVAGHGYTDLICTNGESCSSYTDTPDGETRLKELSECSVVDEGGQVFPPAQLEAWLGARCCWEEP